jgi:hypothetical protein
VIAVGLDAEERVEQLRGCAPAARVDDAVGIDNDEQGETIYVCAGPRRQWSDEWDSIRHLG